MNRKDKLIKIEELSADLLSGKQHLSHSSFSAFLKSPAHFIEYKFGEKKESDAFKVGKLVDTLLLERDKFDERYFVFNRDEVLPFPDKDYRIKANREARDTYLCSFQGLEMIEQHELDDAEKIVASINSVKSARGLLDLCENSQEWLDFEWEGFKWKGAKDKSCEELTLDLKTTQDASFFAFKRSIKKFGYHRQAAIYNTGDGNINKPYFIIAVEKKSPYAVGVHHFQQSLIDEGLSQIQRGLESFRKCLLDESLFLQSYEFWAKKNHGVYEVA